MTFEIIAESIVFDNDIIVVEMNGIVDDIIVVPHHAVALAVHEDKRSVLRIGKQGQNFGIGSHTCLVQKLIGTGEMLGTEEGSVIGIATIFLRMVRLHIHGLHQPDDKSECAEAHPIVVDFGQFGEASHQQQQQRQEETVDEIIVVVGELMQHGDSEAGTAKQVDGAQPPDGESPRMKWHLVVLEEHQAYQSTKKSHDDHQLDKPLLTKLEIRVEPALTYVVEHNSAFLHAFGRHQIVEEQRAMGTPKVRIPKEIGEIEEDCHSH